MEHTLISFKLHSIDTFVTYFIALLSIPDTQICCLNHFEMNILVSIFSLMSFLRFFSSITYIHNSKYFRNHAKYWEYRIFFDQNEAINFRNRNKNLSKNYNSDFIANFVGRFLRTSLSAMFMVERNEFLFEKYLKYLCLMLSPSILFCWQFGYSKDL